MSNTSFAVSGAILLLILTSISPLVAEADDLVIIAHPEVQENAIDGKDLQRIYLGKQTLWGDDTTIVPVMLKSGPVQEEFIEDYVERSLQRFVTYWRQMVFTGKGIPPKGFASEAELVAFVERTPGAVGFASSGLQSSDIKVLTLE